NASATFALNPYDTNPQGIADPPAPVLALPAGDGLVAGTAVQTGSFSPGLIGWLAPTTPLAFRASSNAGQAAFPATATPLAERTLPAVRLPAEMRGPGLTQNRAVDQVFSDPSLGLIHDELQSTLAADGESVAEHPANERT